MSNTNLMKKLRIACLGILVVVVSREMEVKGQTQMAAPQVVRSIRVSKDMQHWDKVNCVAYSPDGKTLASASSDKTVIIWSPETSRELQIFKGHRSAVTCVAFSPDGATLASASWDGTVVFWDVSSGQLPPKSGDFSTSCDIPKTNSLVA